MLELTDKSLYLLNIFEKYIEINNDKLYFIKQNLINSSNYNKFQERLYILINAFNKNNYNTKYSNYKYYNSKNKDKSIDTVYKGSYDNDRNSWIKIENL